MLQGSGDIPVHQRPLHVLNRLAFGPRPGDLEHVKAIGVERFIEEQLHPETLAEPVELVNQIAALRTLHMTPVDLFAEFQPPVRKMRKAERKRSRVILEETVYARIVRAIYGPRQLQEVMTAFWFNHFNVFAGKGLCHLWIGAYEQEAIRPNAMGHFRTLLGATARHPAMLFYLDNWQNTAPKTAGQRGRVAGINENYSRELMELHTLGVNGGYTQQDVIALAHILTGWTILRRNPPVMKRNHRSLFAGGFRGLSGMRRFRFAGPSAPPARPEDSLPSDAVTDEYGFFFNPRRHDYSDQVFLHRHINGAGVDEGEQALDLLARSPATANHLSYELAQYFVADNPPEALVDRMAARYLGSDGDVRAVLETMFTSTEFWERRYCGNKFKTPYEYVISAARATGVSVRNVRPLAGMMVQMGQPLYGCQTPDGYKNTQAAWLNPDAMMMRLSFATALGAGRLPLEYPLLDEFALDDPDRDGRMNASDARVRMVAMGRPSGRGFKMESPDPAQLASTLGDTFSSRTEGAVMAAPPRLRAPLILGSPEFMMR